MESRRFLITGGSQGIGAALVERARQAGHQVVFTGRDAERLAATAKATGAHGFAADVAKPRTMSAPWRSARSGWVASTC